MFTLEDIRTAHGKVKSGADFPQYISDLRKLGITRYETFVSDGHTSFYGAGGHSVSEPRKTDPASVAGVSDPAQFKSDLHAHQQGKTDYITFFKDCAKSGVSRWIVNLGEMTCAYYNIEDKEILIEAIPG